MNATITALVLAVAVLGLMRIRAIGWISATLCIALGIAVGATPMGPALHAVFQAAP